MRCLNCLQAPKKSCRYVAVLIVICCLAATAGGQEQPAAAPEAVTPANGNTPPPNAATQQLPAQADAATAAAPNTATPPAVAGSLSGSSDSTDGSNALHVPLVPSALPRLQSILSAVKANATAAANGSRLIGQDTAAAEAGGFVVRKGTQFFKDGKPFYFVGGNAYWFVDLYTLDWGREKIEEFMDTCQRLGISVIRTWMFNLGIPKAFDRYDSRQLAGLDYIIWAAKKRGLMLTLTVGNLWNAYKGPEAFLEMATGSIAGKDILDFYSDANTRKLYKLHVWGLLSRVNPLTGIAPKNDPAIFSFNIMNEPRCPGCFTPAQQRAHQDWLMDMAAFIRGVTPKHLISASTEGFFVQDMQTMLHWYNPGPGAQCDGEDWFAISSIPYLDYTTVHVYERHMELQPRPSGNPGWPNWIYCDWKCYINWFKMYNQLHTYLAAQVLQKPLVIEEFGLTWWKKTPAQQRVLFQLASDMLLSSARSNGALAGIMFWNAAHNDTVDYDGYNVQIDRPAFTQAGSALPAPTSLPPTMVSDAQAKAMTPDNRTRPVPPDVMFTTAGAPPELLAQMQPVKPPTPARPSAVAPVQPAAALPGALPGVVASSRAAPPATAATAAAANATAVANQTAAQLPAAAAVAAAAAPAAVSTVAGAVGPVQPPAAGQAAAAAAATATTGAAAAAQPTAVQPAATAATTATTATTPFVQAVSTGPNNPVAPATPVSLRSANPLQAAVPAVTSTDSATPGVAVGRRLSGRLLQSRPYTAATQLLDVLEHVGAFEGGFGRGLIAGASASTGSSSSTLKRRQLLVVDDHLDAFRRGTIREECATLSAKTWRPYMLFNLTDNVTGNPRYQAVLQDGEVVAIISDATAKLNQLRSSAQLG